MARCVVSQQPSYAPHSTTAPPDRALGRTGRRHDETLFVAADEPALTARSAHPRHPTLNGDRKPSEVRAGSNQKVWWQCEHGHAWFAPPVGRKRGEGCPDCAPIKAAIKRATPKAGKSLTDLYPEIAADWHPTKNAPHTAADVNPGSKTKRHWLCQTCGWEWKTDPDHRTRSKRGCPACARAKISSDKSKPGPGESLAEKLPELAAEWHPTLNAPRTPDILAPTR